MCTPPPQKKDTKKRSNHAECSHSTSHVSSNFFKVYSTSHSQFRPTFFVLHVPRVVSAFGQAMGSINPVVFPPRLTFCLLWYQKRAAKNYGPTTNQPKPKKRDKINKCGIVGSFLQAGGLVLIHGTPTQRRQLHRGELRGLLEAKGYWKAFCHQKSRHSVKNCQSINWLWIMLCTECPCGISSRAWFLHPLSTRCPSQDAQEDFPPRRRWPLWFNAFVKADRADLQTTPAPLLRSPSS